MDEREMVSRAEAVSQIRSMATQFADLYFCFVQEIRVALGDEAAREMVRRVLFQRARERAQAMVERADAQGVARTPENMPQVSDIAYGLGARAGPRALPLWRGLERAHRAASVVSRIRAHVLRRNGYHCGRGVHGELLA